jgi:hypothetical protein
MSHIYHVLFPTWLYLGQLLTERISQRQIAKQKIQEDDTHTFIESLGRNGAGKYFIAAQLLCLSFIRGIVGKTGGWSPDPTAWAGNYR